MNILVTKNDIDYVDVVKVPTLAAACQVVGNKGFLVYNDSDESIEDKIKYLEILKKDVKKMIYIRSKDETDIAVKMVIQGYEGKYFDDEFFLENSQELKNLINSLDEVTALAEMGGLRVLSDFFNRYLKNGSTDFNSNYLMVVRQAVDTILEGYNQKQLETIRMSETATEIFSNLSALISKMKDEKVGLEEIVSNMAKKLEEPTSISVGTSGSSVLYYPKVNYLNERSIIRIKEIGNFKFLLSFMLGFRSYLENVKNLRPRLIVLEDNGEVLEKMYDGFTWITSSNTKYARDCEDNVVFTNSPNKDVITGLLHDGLYDTFIVLDRRKSDISHILNSKGSKVKYAISGSSCIKKFDLNKTMCMSSISEINGTMLTVPMFKNYPKDALSRENLYVNELSSAYEKLLIDMRRV